MKKVAYCSLLCLLLIGSIACSNNKDKKTTEPLKSSIDVSSDSSTTESISSKKAEEKTKKAMSVKIKPHTDAFINLINNFVQEGLTPRYEGKIGAYEYTDENKEIWKLGENGASLFFFPIENNNEIAISILKFDSDQHLQDYVDALNGKDVYPEEGGKKPLIKETNQYAVNYNQKMVMVTNSPIDEQTFSDYKKVFDSIQ